MKVLHGNDDEISSWYWITVTASLFVLHRQQHYKNDESDVIHIPGPCLGTWVIYTWTKIIDNFSETQLTYILTVFARG